MISSHSLQNHPTLEQVICKYLHDNRTLSLHLV
nr:MAG TPA: hypothetical protein [Caudoviricetes sp.]